MQHSVTCMFLVMQVAVAYIGIFIDTLDDLCADTYAFAKQATKTGCRDLAAENLSRVACKLLPLLLADVAPGVTLLSVIKDLTRQCGISVQTQQRLVDVFAVLTQQVDTCGC